MHRLTILLMGATLALAAPLVAQQETPADTTPATEAEISAEEADQAEDRADQAADEAEAAADQAQDAAEAAGATHDWEFALQPTDDAPGATALVKVTEGDTENSFILDVEELPIVDSLDQEGRDVNAYTVWIVPDKERVQESMLAGVLTVDPEGTGTFEGSTDLDTFGVIVTATTDGAPTQISGVPVLTGIPAAAPGETPAETGTPPAGETPEAVPGAETPEATPEAEEAPEPMPGEAPEQEPPPEAPTP